MNKITFENGTLVTPAKVTIDGTDYNVTPAEYEGNTPLSARSINQMQTNIENAIDSSKVPTGGATGQILAKKSNTDNDVEWVFNDGGVTGDTLPIGAITEWGSDTVPLNWLLCNGQAVSRTTYADLFSVLGTTYGSGDGSTTFNLPDLRRRVPVGKDSTDSDFETLGKTGGEKTHQLTVSELPSHHHWSGDDAVGLFQGWGDKSADGWVNAAREGTGGNWGTGYEGGNQPHNNLQPYITLNFIIKAKQSAGVIAQVLQESDTANTLDVYSSKAVENLIKGTTLYESASGSNSNITLSDTLANYSYIEVFYKNNDNYYDSIKVDNPNNKDIVLTGITATIYNGNPNLVIKTQTRNCNGTSFTVTSSEEISFYNGSISAHTSTNNIYITKVVGYK